MNKNLNRNKLILAAALTGIVAGSTFVATTAFADGKKGAKSGEDHKCCKGKCAGDKKAKMDVDCKAKMKSGEGKCGEGKCGEGKMKGKHKAKGKGAKCGGAHGCGDSKKK